MTYLDTISINAIASLVWPLCRVGGFFMAMFMIGGNAVPTRVRALFSLAVTICILPSIPQISEDAQPFSGEGIITTFNQVLIGIAIGYMTQFLVQSFVVSGQVIAMQTGLGFASLVDPVSGTNAPVIGQFFTVLVTLVFFAVNGHLLFIRLLLLSFETMPIGPHGFNALNYKQIVDFGSVMFQIAIAMSISSICSMLIINFTFGVMTKAAPQLNVFSMGFAISMIAGFFVLVFSLNSFMGNFYNAINVLTETTCSLISTECEGIFR